MKIYLIGAKNPESIRMIKAICKRGTWTSGMSYEGFLDSDPKKKGTKFHGFKVHGWTEVMEEINGEFVRFCSMVTGTTQNRKKSYDAIANAGGMFTSLIHPSVNLEMVSYKTGCYIQESVVLQAEVKLGINVSIHIGSMIGHETIIGDHVFIAHAVSISGCCEIGEGALIGTNATILPRLKIGRWATIGAGAVVTKDVPDGAVVIGNPAKQIGNFQ
jgi:sugar O-acyltransferase (sialic acid O-acetyltransferase NeuD family)